MTDLNTATGEHDERPLVTFALFAYNQEKFICEAVEGALAQTYSPLQIILSDDCSSDRTFEIMQEMVERYSGPHDIILNRNVKNLGIGGHVNRIMEISSGEYIVVAAGDDISLPHRVDKVINAWSQCGRKASLIYSCADVVNEDGDTIDTIGHEPTLENSSVLGAIAKEFPSPVGCANAWHRDVFKFFGPMMDNVVSEDRVVAFRAFFLGGYYFIPESLVKYRIHGDNVYNRKRLAFNYKEHAERAKKIESIHYYTFRQYEIDIKEKIVQDYLGIKLCKNATKLIKRKIKTQSLQILMLEPEFSQRFLAMLYTLKPPILAGRFVRYFLRIFVPYLHRRTVSRNYQV